MSGGQREELLERARDAYASRDWTDARSLFSEAKKTKELAAADVSALGDCCWWLGDADGALDAYEAAYRSFLSGDEKRSAAFNAVGLAVTLFLRGEAQLGSGWMARAQRLLEDEPEGVEHGYLAYLGLEGALEIRDFELLLEEARRVGSIGQRHGDPNLIAVGATFEGRALIGAGRVEEGMARLDDAALSVLEGTLVPDWAGNVYCNLMAAFYELLDLQRAGEWVEATQRWLDTLPAAVLFTGICRIHRSQIMTLQGAWDDAEREARRVAEELRSIHVAGAAEGHYLLGELARLRGEMGTAESAFERARALGRDPQPGLALVHLARGDADGAARSVRTALLAAGADPLRRAPLLVAQVEIMIANADLDEAERTCEELEAVADRYRSSGLIAHAREARGAVLVASGRIEEALPVLRDACQRWRELKGEHHAANVCVLLAQAYESIGDDDSARREREVARNAFERLGATADLARIQGNVAGAPGGLSAREVEVLRLVAAGRSNRQVAEELVLSEKTVARHLSNIFTKLGVGSRTEAAAFAFAKGLVPVDW